MFKRIIFTFFVAAAVLPAPRLWAQTTLYSCNFNSVADSAGWLWLQQDQTNQWVIGTPDGMTDGCLYVSAGGGSSNYYNSSVMSVSYVCRRVALPRGWMRVSFDWRSNGVEYYGYYSDYLRVLLLPSDVMPVAGMEINDPLPAGASWLDGGTPLVYGTSWSRHSSTYLVESADTFNLVFMWHNYLYGADSQPPAAIDDLLIAVDSCPPATWLYADPLTPTSFTLHWSDLGVDPSVRSWVLELCSASQPFGSGTSYTTTDTMYVFNGLVPNTDYRVYVRGICGSDSCDTAMLRVHTPCVAIGSLPYVEDFSSVSLRQLPSCWRRLSTVGVGVTTDTAEGGLLRWSTEGSSRHGVVLPAVDVAGRQLGEMQLTLRARCAVGGVSRLLAVGVMTNPEREATFVPVDTLRFVADVWQRYCVGFASYDGNGKYIALREMDDSLALGGIVWLDDVVVDFVPDCPVVYGLEAAQVSAVGTWLSWDAPQPTSSYEVRVEQVAWTTGPATAPSDSSIVFLAYEPRLLLDGLESFTTYRAWVRARCGTASYGQWESVSFTTLALPCVSGDTAGADTVALGLGSNHTTGVPVSYYYVNSLCQSIYTAAELHAAGLEAGLITGVDYTFTANSHPMIVSLYLSNTSDAMYGAVGDMLPVFASQRMYGPAYYAAGSSGTIHFDFATPYVWDGIGNLVLTSIINNATGAMLSPMFYGNSTQIGVNRTVFGFLNDTAFTPDNMADGNLSLSQYRPSVMFRTMECVTTAECAPPVVVVREVGADYARVEWTTGYAETAWDVYYQPVGADTVWSLVDSVVTNHYCYIPLLLPLSEYSVRVVARCGDGSAYAEAHFVTQCGAVGSLPLVEDFESFIAPWRGDMEPCWHRYSIVSEPPHIRNNCYHGGAQSLLLSTSFNMRDVSFLSLPAMEMDVSLLQVEFYSFSLSGYDLRVGVATDPDDYTTFTEVERLTPLSTGVWEHQELDFGDYGGEGRHIAFMVVGRGSSLFLDDLRVDYTPPCPRPRGIVFGSIGRTTAEVEWDGRGVGNYVVEYGPSGFVPGTGIMRSTTHDTITLTGLSHSTAYDLYVHSLCGGGDTMHSFPVSFSTLCGTIGSLPYTLSFSQMDVGTRPYCWTCGGYYSSNYPYVVDVSGVCRAFSMPGNRFTEVYALLPPVDTLLGDMDSLQVVLRAWRDPSRPSMSPHCIVVGVCSTEGDFTTFYPLDTVALTTIPTIYEVPLHVAAGGSVSSLGRSIALYSTAIGDAAANYVFLDSVAVEYIPSCVSPQELTATAVGTTVATIGWSARGGAARWQVEYMPHGVAIGSGTRLMATSNSVTLTGLAPATQYDFYVRGICGEGDTSRWSHQPAFILTRQVPATVPYTYNFDSLQEWNNWQVLSNCAVGWYRGVTDGGYGHCMYLSADSGNTRSTFTDRVVNTVAFRDIDFGNNDTSYVLSFSAIAGTPTGYGGAVGGLAVFLADPSVSPTAPSDMVFQSPWGPLDELTLLANIQVGSTWNDYSIVLDSLVGLQRLVFYSYNRVESMSQTSALQPAAVDNVAILPPECQHPYSLRASEVTSASAVLRWHGRATSDYRLQLFDVEGRQLRCDTVRGNTITYFDLLPGTPYRARVCHLCDDGMSSWTPMLAFSTLACPGGSTDVIGGVGSASRSYSLPLSTTYPYSVSQQIVLASELHGSGEITSINFLYDSPLAMTVKTNCTVYLGHTTRSGFSVGDIVPLEELSAVYIGSLNCSNGWNRFLLDSPFAYDGSSNLVVAVVDNSGVAHNYNYRFVTASRGGYSYLSMAVDGDTNIDLSSPRIGYSQMYSYSFERNCFAFDFCPPNPCPAPMLRSPRVRANDVTLRWRSTSYRYLLGYRYANSERWIVNDLPLTDTFYTITNYQFDRDYVYHVRQYCDSNAVSNWAMGTFNTADIPCLPPLGLEVEELNGSEVRLRWTPEDNNISYRVHVWGRGYDTIITSYLASASVGGLGRATRYYAAVEVHCEYIDQPSIWSDTISFITPTCPAPHDLEALEIHSSSALIDWQCDSSVHRWLIEWGLRGFDQGSGSYVETDHHPFLVTGLSGETAYDIVVRSMCSDDWVSEDWSERLTITTTLGVADIDGNEWNVRLGPNPTVGDVSITLPSGLGLVNVEVVDMQGRVRQYYRFDSANGLTYTLATTELPMGAYYVQLTSDRLSLVKKIVVGGK